MHAGTGLLAAAFSLQRMFPLAGGFYAGTPSREELIYRCGLLELQQRERGCRQRLM